MDTVPLDLWGWPESSHSETNPFQPWNESETNGETNE